MNVLIKRITDLLLDIIIKLQEILVPIINSWNTYVNALPLRRWIIVKLTAILVITFIIFSTAMISYSRYHYGYFNSEISLTEREQIYAQLANHFFPICPEYFKDNLFTLVINLIIFNLLETFHLNFFLLIILLIFFEQTFWIYIFRVIFIIDFFFFIDINVMDYLTDDLILNKFFNLDVFFLEKSHSIWDKIYENINTNFIIFGINLYLPNFFSISKIVENLLSTNNYANLTEIFINLPQNINLHDKFIEEIFFINIIAFIFKKKVIYFFL